MKRPSLAAVLAAAGLVLGGMAGCGSCVQDDPRPAPVAEGVPPRRPLNIKAVQKGLSQFSDSGDVADAAAD